MKTIALALFSFLLSGLIDATFSNDLSSDPELFYRIRMLDGSSLIGKIISEDENSIVLRTISGFDRELELSEIESTRTMRGRVRNGKFILTDPNSNRLLFIPTARPLPDGAGSIALYEVFFPMVSIGFADAITLAGGYSIHLSTVEQVYYFAPKVTVLTSDNLDIACGMMYFNSTKHGSEGNGIVYVVGTKGSSERAITLGLMWDYRGEELEKHPMGVIGGEIQISNTHKLIMENWFSTNSKSSMTSIGVRFIGPRVSSEFGLFTSLDTGSSFSPWINMIFNFGYN